MSSELGIEDFHPFAQEFSYAVTSPGVLGRSSHFCAYFPSIVYTLLTLCGYLFIFLLLLSSEHPQSEAVLLSFRLNEILNLELHYKI